MAAEAKALLDELMGRSRNLDPSQQPPDLKWSDDDVCKYFLCGFCPHELFTNTRADLGPCTKIHDEALRKDYQNHSRFEKCGYEDDFMRFLNTLVNDVEKRIRRGHQRLALNNQQASLNDLPNNSQDEKTTMLTERINELVVQAEELGCEGKVEEAQGVMKLVDQLKEERQQLELKPMHDDGPLMKQMEVCEVCGAFLIVGDAPQRQDEHLMGKQHAGYAQVRAEIERRKKKVRDELEAREASENKLRQEREDREKERQRERDERRQKERDAEKRRERDRDRRRRSRSRSRERGKDRRRSRSRDRRRQRSSSRDRRSRRSGSRNKDRKRSSSRGKRSSRRSSSRDRKHESKRSRDTESRSRGTSRDRKRRSKDKEKDGERNGTHREEAVAYKTGCRDSLEEQDDSKGVQNDKGISDDGDTDGLPVTSATMAEQEEGEASSASPPPPQLEKEQKEGACLANVEGDTKMDE